jgi:hypothetical protein
MVRLTSQGVNFEEQSEFDFASSVAKVTRRSRTSFCSAPAHFHRALEAVETVNVTKRTHKRKKTRRENQKQPQKQTQPATIRSKRDSTPVKSRAVRRTPYEPPTPRYFISGLVAFAGSLLQF